MKKLIINQQLTDLNKYIASMNNSRYAGNTIKQIETDSVAWHVRFQKFTGFDNPPYIVHIDWFVKDAKKDADNIVFTKKFILDGLVAGGAIKNDSRRYIAGFVEKIHIDKLRPRVEVKLEELQDK
jgi:Holliday junction resolvase RusA-like endonuclease